VKSKKIVRVGYVKLWCLLLYNEQRQTRARSKYMLRGEREEKSGGGELHTAELRQVN
jgi:hypothetical protein